MRTVLFVAALVALTSSFVDAAPLVQFNFSGQPGDQVTQSPSLVAANLTGLDMSRGAGLGVSAGGSSFGSNNWDDATADEYVSFGFSVATGYYVDLTNVQFGGISSATGPGNLGLYYSGNGFASPIQTFSNSNSQVNYDLDLSTLPNLTGNIEFRIRPTNQDDATPPGSIAGTGTFRLNNFSGSPMTIFGTVAEVPEPKSFLVWIFIGGCALLFVWPFKRMRRRDLRVNSSSSNHTATCTI